jgi:Homing endonuclease associated repeat
MGRKSYNKEELKGFIDKFFKENGRYPERRDFEKNKEYPSYRQYVREWGSWGDAFIKMGYRDSAKEKKALKTYECRYCKRDFHSYHNSRKFCSIECRDSYKPRKVSSNTYRALAFTMWGISCEICGYDEDTHYISEKHKNVRVPSVLDVHHIDENRGNNHFLNLAVLCPTCHVKIHRGILLNVRREGKFNILKFDKPTATEFYNKQKERRKKNRQNEASKRRKKQSQNLLK